MVKTQMRIAETKKLLAIYGKMTERQIYYKLISMGLGKSGKSFANDLSKILCKARRNGEIDPSLIIDTSREIVYIEPKEEKEFINNLKLTILRYIETNFAINVWEDQKEMPIVILEKFALKEIFEEVTNKYYVPLNVNRGFTSDAKLFELSTLIPKNRRVVFQTYSDFDYSGKHMYLSLNKTASYYITNFRVEQSALTQSQIQKYKLQMIPKYYKQLKATKMICELDALDPNDLKNLIKDNIEKCIDNKPMFNKRLKELDKKRKQLMNLFYQALETI